MTSQELHIHLDILLQKISSNWNKNFLPQELDILINREISKFLKQRINPLSNKKKLGMFDTLKRIQDTNALTKTEEVPVVINNQMEVELRLPFDFLYYINTELEVIKNCKGSANMITKTKYVRGIKLPSSINGITSLTLDLEYNNETINLFDFSQLSVAYLSNQTISSSSLFMVINALFIFIKKRLPTGFNMRYLNGIEEFEISCSLPFSLSLKINNEVVENFNRDYTYEVPISSKVLLSSLEIIDSEFATKIKLSSLSKSKDKSTKGQMFQDKISIVHNESVLISKASLTYICKPSRVDLLLNNSSELPDEILYEVISNVAEAIKGITSSDTYEKFINENSMIE